MPKAKIKAIDFFCGAGCLTRASTSSRAWTATRACAKPTSATTSLAGSSIRTSKDVRIDDLRKELGIAPSDAVLYAACAPCQPFSILSAMRGDDGRKSLLLDFAEIVTASPPDFIIAENAPGLSSASGRGIYKKFKFALESLGFRIAADTLDAKRCGVPQTRRRFILIASRHGQPSLPAPDAESEVRTVRDCIARYPAIADGERSDAYPNHEARRLQPHHKRIVQAVPRDGGGRSGIADASILLKCHQKNPKAHKDVFGRMAWDSPSPTMTCCCIDVYCGRLAHPEQDRGISLREAAALQSFPDGYEFCGKSLLEKSRQIGVAAPVELARRLGAALLASV